MMDRAHWRSPGRFYDSDREEMVLDLVDRESGRVG